MVENYENRINRVVDYIQANLGESLSIKQLSEIACYSEFHFNRIFKPVMGEPVYTFIQRLRLEKSADLLLSLPRMSVTEIALDCGFATSSSFAKCLKKHFKMCASEWRIHSTNIFNMCSKPVQIDRGRISIANGSPVWTFENKDSICQVIIENIPDFQVAYIRNVGPYQQDDALFDRLHSQLIQWAAPRGYINESSVIFNIYHDNPEITDNVHLRVMVAIPVDGKVAPSCLIGVTDISGGK